MMWAQYADNHHGICLEIDEDLFIYENRHLNIFKFENIQYNLETKARLHWNVNVCREENMESIIDSNFRSLFLTKSHYWEKEYEKRLLVFVHDLCKLRIAKSLTGIYYGLSHDNSLDVALEQFLDKSKTAIFKVYYNRSKLDKVEKLELYNGS